MLNTMPDRLIPDTLWRHQEAALRYRSHAKAARDAADSPYTSQRLRRNLLEAEARWTIRAREEAEKAKGME